MTLVNYMLVRKDSKFLGAAGGVLRAYAQFLLSDDAQVNMQLCMVDFSTGQCAHGPTHSTCCQTAHRYVCIPHRRLTHPTLLCLYIASFISSSRPHPPALCACALVHNLPTRLRLDA